MHTVPINEYRVLLYFSMHVMYCALSIGFLVDDVIGCMVVPFHILSLL
jgi:hypothetical protein